MYSIGNLIVRVAVKVKECGSSARNIDIQHNFHDCVKSVPYKKHPCCMYTKIKNIYIKREKNNVKKLFSIFNSQLT